jgi:hypothetical protein
MPSEGLIPLSYDHYNDDLVLVCVDAVQCVNPFLGYILLIFNTTRMVLVLLLHHSEISILSLQEFSLYIILQVVEILRTVIFFY